MVEQATQLDVALRRDVGCLVVEIAGELDLATAPKLRHVLCGVVHDGECQVVVDLGRLEFIDLSGLSVFEDIGRELARRYGLLVLRHPSRQMSRLLALREEWERDELWKLER